MSAITTAERMVQCITKEDDVVEVPYRLMKQSRLFAEMELALDGNGSNEEKAEKNDEKNDEPLQFPIKTIDKKTFEQLVKWMVEHDGKPEVVVKEDPNTQERIWFELTDWQRKFFKVDVETMKEYFLAANYLHINSLYLYCAQEIARYIMDKNVHEVAEIMGIENDMTPEEQARVREEFQITD